MSLFRPTTLFSRATRNLRFSSPVQARQFTVTANSLSTQGYGDGKGDPKGSDPSAQGATSKASQKAQHPGPAAPADGKSSASGQKDPADASAQSGGSRSKEAKETGSSPTGGAVGKRGFSTSVRRRINDDKGQADAEKNAKKGGDIKEETEEPQVEGAKPKILDTQSGEGISEEKKAEVDEHNKEFAKGHDRAGKRDAKPRDADADK